ncbi:hypothetical protein [Streptomyces sp. NBC_00154]|uniref:hypothetical protein n=1 Tax=Streptomyces sp. NBC_00154 TaxID=2975670 RepID=UPI00225631D4|nr:hypothetical protein [Streptomyces sp. NBC_00154]MCX5318153.1 hypothetical protein [Streptomyces sp. NBC_00154]
MKKNNSKKALVAGAALAAVLATPVAAQAAPAPVTSRLANLSGTSLDQPNTCLSVLTRSLDLVSEETTGRGAVRPMFNSCV